MTTVVCDRKGMASDLQATLGKDLKFKVKGKAEHFPDGSPLYPALGEFMVGFAGNVNEWVEFLDYLIAPEGYKRPPKVEIQLLFLTKKGQIFYGSAADRIIAVNEPYFSIGSGSVAAMGALHAGATLKDTIKAASKIDPNTGMGIKEYNF